MKLNPDCVRDILLDIEETTTINTSWVYDSQTPSKRLSRYDKFEIAYHARQCYASQLVSDFHLYGDSDKISISDLAPAGHEFLTHIRSDTFFGKVKAIAKQLGLESLSDFRQIATASAAVAIKAYFNLP